MFYTSILKNHIEFLMTTPTVTVARVKKISGLKSGEWHKYLQQPKEKKNVYQQGASITLVPYFFLASNTNFVRSISACGSRFIVYQAQSGATHTMNTWNPSKCSNLLCVCYVARKCRRRMVMGGPGEGRWFTHQISLSTKANRIEATGAKCVSFSYADGTHKHSHETENNTK